MSLQNDPDLRINLRITNFLFLMVIIIFFGDSISESYNKLIIIKSKKRQTSIGRIRVWSAKQPIQLTMEETFC